MQLELAALPDCVFLARNSTLPDLHVQHTLGVLLGFGPEAERVVFPPLLSVEGMAPVSEAVANRRKMSEGRRAHLQATKEATYLSSIRRFWQSVEPMVTILGGYGERSIRKVGGSWGWLYARR